MKIKFGSIVTDGRGKLGGQVYSKNRTGAYVRNKVTPVNARTAFQQAARQALGALSSQWSGLSQAARDAWNGAVGMYTKTNIFGDTVTPTGKNLFVGLNRNLANAGYDAINSPVAPVSLPTIALDSFLNGSEDGGTTDQLSVALSIEGDAAGTTALIFATPPLSPGKQFVKNDLRLISTQADPSDSTAINILDDYIARFGEPVEGQRIAVSVALVAQATGQKGVPITFSSITTITG